MDKGREPGLIAAMAADSKTQDPSVWGTAKSIQEEQMRILEDAGHDPGIQSLIAREEARQQIPEFDPPTATEVLGEICETCHGITWVIRANPELEGPVMAQLMHCDNPDCPQTAALGDRKIIHLALPYNTFNRVISLPNGTIVALTED